MFFLVRIPTLHKKFQDYLYIPPQENKREGGVSAGVSPISILSPKFDPDSVVRNLDLDTEFLDHLLNQVPSNNVERVLEDQAPVHHGDSDMGEPEQSGTGSPPILPYTALQHAYVFRAEFGDLLNTLTSDIIYTYPADIAHSYATKIQTLLER